MIDTVCLTLPVRMHPPADMMALGFSAACRHPTPDCSHPARWKFHPPKKPHLIWSEAPDHSHWLSLTGSLPRFMFGSNVYLLCSDDELRTCLEGVSHYVSDAAQVNFDCLSANVARVDYSHNWKLTNELVNQYLWALRGISLPRMRKTLIDNSTVQLSNKAQTICFYDKFGERLAISAAPTEREAAKGILRLEIRFNDNRSCQRHSQRMGLADRKAEALLTDRVAKRTITSALQRLGLDKAISADSKRLQMLRSYCGENRAKFFRLAGFLASCDAYGSDNLVQLGYCSYTDYRRKLAEVKASGALYVTEGPASLPPLSLVEVPETFNSSEAA
jgi:hypothetical protein